jgi:hypothetical protein
VELYLRFPMRLRGVSADSFTFTDKRQKGTELRNAQAVPWTVVTEIALLSDPRSEERERRQNAITKTRMFIHTPQRCVGSIPWPVGTQSKGKGEGRAAPVHTVKAGLQDRRSDTAPVIFIRETRKIWVAALTSRPHYLRYAVPTRLRASHNLNGRFGGQKVCYRCRETNDSTIVQPVA